MEYKLIRRRGQKNIRMHFNDRGELLVSCPYFTTINRVESFIASKTEWIIKNKNKFVSHTYQQGDVLPYFGRNLHLTIVECKKHRIEVSEDELVVYASKTDPEYIKRKIMRFYSDKLFEFCAPRLDFWSKTILVRTPDLKITNSKSRWGVCYPTENLVKISLISATLEPELLDMIVLHETCHLAFCNHQKEFYGLMEKAMPDFRKKNTRFKRFVETGIHRNLF